MQLANLPHEQEARAVQSRIRTGNRGTRARVAVGQLRILRNWVSKTIGSVELVFEPAMTWTGTSSSVVAVDGNTDSVGQG